MDTRNHLGPEIPGWRRAQELSKFSTSTAMKLTGHSNTILYLILGNMERIAGRAKGKICCRPEVVKQKRVRKGFPGSLLPSHFKASAHHQLIKCKPPL